MTSRPTIILSLVQPSDLEALIAIRIEAMRESLERIGRFDPARVRDRLGSTFSAEYTRHIVCSGECVGFVVLRPVNGELLLDHLYIKANSQGRGIGSAVLGHLFSEADAESVAIRVGALRESASNRFYARHGFELVQRGENDNYYVRPSKNVL